jgi:Leucine-rich repeat (LRR) protein
MNEILQKSNTFSPESVFTISLTNRALTKLPTYIEQFKYLNILDLSHNSLTELALSGLTQLKHLDMSFNRLRVFALTVLPRLQTLRMQGNVLDSLEVLKAGLAGVSSIENFSLRLPNGDAANPVCYLEVYEEEIRGLLGNMKFLDGQIVNAGFGEVWRKVRTVTRDVRELEDKEMPNFHVDKLDEVEAVDVNEEELKMVNREYENLKKAMQQLRLELTS